MYILDMSTALGMRSGQCAIGGASKWWLHHSLHALSEELEKQGSPLYLRSGDVVSELRDLCAEVGADQVVMHESTDPAAQPIEDTLDDQLNASGIELVRFSPDVLWPVGSVLTGSMNPYKVFTPFWNKASTLEVEKPVAQPIKLRPPVESASQVKLDSLGLIDTVDWASEFSNRWSPGEANAKVAFQNFISNRVSDYHMNRDQLSRPGWSALSASIHFGELSIRRMWHELMQVPHWDQSEGVLAYRRQLGWHDFAIHLLNHFPHTTDLPFHDQFQQFPWASNNEYFTKWKQGMTGYPIVDAAMRNLWAEGWMPNRARMIVASFLCKHLLISWKEGAEWFWDTLVDADLANNTFGWQWTAGCGADAAPYFRIFNPMTQGKKFDPHGEYVRKWVPELVGLPNSTIHTPWETSEIQLQGAGVILGEHYPYPIVDHGIARNAALDAYAKIKS